MSLEVGQNYYYNEQVMKVLIENEFFVTSSYQEFNYEE